MTTAMDDLLAALQKAEPTTAAASAAKEQMLSLVGPIQEYVQDCDAHRTACSALGAASEALNKARESFWDRGQAVEAQQGFRDEGEKEDLAAQRDEYLLQSTELDARLDSLLSQDKVLKERWEVISMRLNSACEHLSGEV